MLIRKRKKKGEEGDEEGNLWKILPQRGQLNEHSDTGDM